MLPKDVKKTLAAGAKALACIRIGILIQKHHSEFYQRRFLTQETQRTFVLVTRNPLNEAAACAALHKYRCVTSPQNNIMLGERERHNIFS